MKECYLGRGVEMPEKSAAVSLHALFREEWEAHLADDPFFATVTGDRRYNDRLPEASEARFARRAEALRRFLDRVQHIDRQALSDDDRLNVDVFRRLKQEALAEIDFRTYLMPITRMGGFHTALAELSNLVMFDRLQDFEDYLARLAGLESYLEGETSLMRRGLAEGVTQPRAALQGAEASIDAFLTEDPE